MINTDSSLDMSLTQVMKILLTVVADTWNLNPKSVVKKASLNCIKGSRNSYCSLSFLSDPGRPLVKPVANSKGEGGWGVSLVACFSPLQYCIDRAFLLK